MKIKKRLKDKAGMLVLTCGACGGCVDSVCCERLYGAGQSRGE